MSRSSHIPTLAIKLGAISLALTFMLPDTGLAGIKYVDNGPELQSALKTANPGDEIILRPGNYFGEKSEADSGHVVGHFYSNRSGTASNPIIVRSQSTANKQTLKGGNTDNGYVFLLQGDYWQLRDLKFSTAQKGIMLEGANYNLIDNVEVHNLGAEAVHFRRFSSNNVLSNCYIHNTGKRVGKEGLGEGVYVGTHDGHEADKYDPSNNNRIGGCHIGPNVGGEAFDVKAGTQGTVIESNYMDGRGIIGTASFPNANSFIDLKGTNNIVRGNIMDYRGEPNIEHAIQTSDEHRNSNFYDNTYTLNSSTYTYNLQEETVHLSNETRTDGGTQVVRKSYQESHYDFSLDSSIEKPYAGPYPCFDELSGGCGSNTSGGGDTNTPPSVSFSQPSGNLTVNEGYDLTVVANATDADGTIETVVLFINDQAVRTEKFMPYEWGHDGSPNPNEVNGLSAGTYDFVVEATDDEGATASDSFRLTVNGDDSGGGDSGDGDNGGGGSGNCQSYSSGRAELDLSNGSCISVAGGLNGKTLQFWDSDTNPSCNFRGSANSTDGSGSITITKNYQSTTGFSGSTLAFSASNGCQFIKFRAY